MWPPPPEPKQTASAKTNDRPKPSASEAAPKGPPLLTPKHAKAKAPDVFKVKLVTTKGDIVIEAHRKWAPRGVDRFYNLVKIGFYKDIAFFRVVLLCAGFVVFSFYESSRHAHSFCFVCVALCRAVVRSSTSRSFASCCISLLSL